MELFFKLLIGHAFADFVFQSDSMSRGKNKNNVPQNIPLGQKPQVSWWYWLTAHSLVHGGVVFAITGSWKFGFMETLFHWVIDFLKCQNKFGIHMDQALHIQCKIMWCVL
ncbi:MAG: DUF3307 domain-containing protein [Gammaproteobacteria bacterium]|nr:DUF3307 domain-containing protein [Gammaproteobacteria bacterium]